MTEEDPHRHELSREQKAMSDTQLAASLPAGTGLSVYRSIFWDVVARIGEQGKLEFIVTETHQGVKPWRVHGPVGSRKEAIDWVNVTAQLYAATHGGHIDDDFRPFY